MDRALPLAKARRRREAGGKVRTLARLATAGFDVPEGFVLLPDHLTSQSQVSSAIAGLLDHGARWAVRSSAAVEDGTQRSWAGQFHTILNVAAADVPAVALEVAQSPASPVYSGSAEDGTLALLVQRMIQPHLAGVVFTRNPVTGVRETVVEAVSGTADAFVAGRSSPERWIWRGGAWVERPEQPRLPEETAQRIADGAARIERELGYAVDSEWAWDGRLWWLQARPVTTGTRTAVYSSRMARDMLPGVILPLVWSVNGPAKSRVFLAFLEDVLGPLDVAPEDLGALIHHRFYINIGALSRLFAEFGLPEDSLERLAGMEAGSMPPMRPTAKSLRRLPRLVRAGLRYSRFSEHLARRLPELWARSRGFAAATGDPARLDAAALLRRMDHLGPLVAEVTFHHVVTLLLMQMYAAWARALLQRRGLLEPGEPLDLSGGSPAEHDVGAALHRLADVAAAAPPAIRELLQAADLAALRALGDDGGFGAALDRFMHLFGHFSDSGVNFSSVTWGEQPERVLGMVAATMDAPARKRQARADLPGQRRPTRYVWNRAGAFSRHRDETSSLYSYTYGQYRPLVLALGDRLSELGALATREDVFYLTRDEARRVVAGAITPREARTIVASRREEMTGAADWELPEVLVGDVVPLVTAAHRTTLSGLAVSRGRYTGRVTLCRGIADLPRIADGAVVVVPFSDASWTPLFLRAGAIVAESGGMLSHSAILARELGVPAVTAVRGALALADGDLVTVDGYTGVITRVEGTER